MNAANLRPYRTCVDAEELEDEEFVIDELLKRRTVREQRQYLVKWRGYPRSEATWEPAEELGRRCAELLEQFEAVAPVSTRRVKHPVSAPVPPPPVPVSLPPPPPAPLPPLTPDLPEDPGSHLPHSARFQRGKWFYVRRVTTPRGPQQRVLPAANFTQSELESEHFLSLRQSAMSTPMERVVAALLDHHPELSPTDLPCSSHAAKVLFLRRSKDAPEYPSEDEPASLVVQNYELLSYVRADSDPAKPQYDSFGGTMDLRDDRQYHRCALRELREEAKVHRLWSDPIGLELASFPEGHKLVDLFRRANNRSYRQALWVVLLPRDVSHLPVRPTDEGLREMKPDSLRWRSAADVIDNISTFRTFHPIATALGAQINDIHSDA
eukprot:2930301-Prymnesium_polylepis.1